MLVVLEGLDGAGKSTQVKKLRTYLGERYFLIFYLKNFKAFHAHLRLCCQVASVVSDSV